ncbi:Glucuronoxylan 4-O-methyltransferase 1 [Linum grandiflorum]
MPTTSARDRRDLRHGLGSNHDAPTGYHDEAPRRMTANYTVGLMARGRRKCLLITKLIERWKTDYPRRFSESEAHPCEGYLMSMKRIFL